MTDLRHVEPFKQLGLALITINNILSGKESGSEKIVRDALIQRFKFTIELFWKTLMALLKLEGIDAKSPKASLKEAYKLEWLDNEDLWLNMLEDRNLTSHTYKEEIAKDIFRKIPTYYEAINQVYTKLKIKYNIQ